VRVRLIETLLAPLILMQSHELKHKLLAYATQFYPGDAFYGSGKKRECV